MQPSTRNPIERWVDRIGRFVLYVLFMIALLEASSWIFIKIYYPARNQQSVNMPLVNPAAMLELAEVQSNSMVFPTRWYTNQPNYKGKYVITDESGFRINPANISHPKSIGFFGGSTMFSVATDQANTIPDQVKLPLYNALNFGVGGYSTGAELPTFIEAIRKYDSVRIAVFYDGVNEIGRYLEMLQDAAPEKVFDKVGYYYRTGLETAIKASPSYGSLELHIKTPSMTLIERVLARLRAGKHASATDIEAISSRIADLYLSNIHEISEIAKSKSVRAYFFLQPNIFTTKKILSGNEARILGQDKSLLPKLASAVRDRIMSDKRAKLLNVIDLTMALDKVQDEVFFDWCHLNGAGNKYVAERIIENIKSSI